MSYDSHVSNKPRTLVLCFDGTANEFNDQNTNVVKLYSMITKDQPAEQITYYQAGIGTYFDPGVVSPLFSWGAKLLDEATAWYLGGHVRDGYHFLMQNYREGDKISLFGFSRGAYTARALAGFLHKIGLLSRDNSEHIPFAYKLYQRTDKKGIELSRGFKKTFCRPIIIDFVGVWDTVASVGLLYGRDLPFTNSNAGIKVFRHALSLDEHRARFQPNMYHRDSDVKPAGPGIKRKCPSSVEPSTPNQTSSRIRSKLSKARRTWKVRSSSWKFKSHEKLDDGSNSSEDRCKSDVLETWFAGTHSDVGGGSVQDSVTESLSEIPLRWMIHQVQLSQCGVLFDPEALRRADIDPQPVYHHSKVEPNQSTATSLSEETALKDHDIQSIHDELKLCIWWWILEMCPMKYTWQDVDGKWHKKWGFNFGKGRVIREEHPNFHVSVKRRMGNDTLKYTPRAKWEPGQEIYID